jgi:hypothetical protein
MIDPLERFDWASLHCRYDAICRGFDASVAHLAEWSPRPQSDRDLYYRLIDAVHDESDCSPRISIGLYEAMLYWKLYSNPQSRGNVARWFVQANRETIAYGLDRLMKSLPDNVGHDVDRIISLVRQIGEYAVLGMKSQTALPARTTFLLSLFPDNVPIFDRMVLQAVGISDKEANKDFGSLRQFIPFAWRMADCYSIHFAGFREAHLRLIDMALWGSRGGC